jgi:GntR family transcriptional regulator, transcriptional repressor for pyruvate dehydrogenase complex
MRRERLASTTEGVYTQMLENIQAGQWPVGSEIPSERDLIDQFGVSRIAVREAVSMLRGMGVVDVNHGRRTRVRKVDAQVLDQLLPLMLATGGQRTFQQIFDVRLALESQAAYVAATTRTDKQMKRIEMLVKRFRRLSRSGSGPAALKTDFEFHLEIAKATGNPLFSILLEALTRFVVFGQNESCKNDPERRQRAVRAHAAIADALADRDADRARVEMEAHLRYSASRVIEAMQNLS